MVERKKAHFDVFGTVDGECDGSVCLWDGYEVSVRCLVEW